MRVLHFFAQLVLWMAVPAALIAATDFTSGHWAPLAVIAVAVGASLALSRMLRSGGGLVQDPERFIRFRRPEVSDRAIYAESPLA